MAGTAEEPAAAVIDQGTGPPLLLLHGWGATKELMAPVAQRLHGYRIVVPDLPGFGATPPPPEGWGVDDYAAWVIALLDRLGIERTHIVGHSNGFPQQLLTAIGRPAGHAGTKTLGADGQQEVLHGRKDRPAE